MELTAVNALTIKRTDKVFVSNRTIGIRDMLALPNGGRTLFLDTGVVVRLAPLVTAYVVRAEDRPTARAPVRPIEARPPFVDCWVSP
ncbi:hypothetical protein [Streptomyces yaizuensis]|uniref:Uncharacterized protein n=1 Tax=Streptomyces yaizuensis TaxID=2989713 RepID=A0ABQ5NVM1_9ACTN|nr:hypothetical protein [Streptomyces sp. YSPA8]GLF94406.1 hypothetical protein SYYSPA8_08935 [Streptomyces sp. YSPA8]